MRIQAIITDNVILTCSLHACILSNHNIKTVFLFETVFPTNDFFLGSDVSLLSKFTY